MRRLALLLVCSLFTCLLHGCQSPAWKKSGVEVVIDGDGQFPDFLVGRWTADTGGWEIVFEPNGTISSAVVSLGRVRMRPGQVTTVPMQLGGKGVFEPGPWVVQYSHEQRELIVEIAIDRFRVELGKSVLHGKTRDIFVGSISADGRLWWAERFSFPEYVADTKKYHNHRLIVDPNDAPHEGVLFQKAPEESRQPVLYRSDVPDSIDSRYFCNSAAAPSLPARDMKAIAFLRPATASSRRF